MSTNCIRCVENLRTGPDLLCDERRSLPSLPVLTREQMDERLVAAVFVFEGDRAWCRMTVSGQADRHQPGCPAAEIFVPG